MWEDHLHGFMLALSMQMGTLSWWYSCKAIKMLISILSCRLCPKVLQHMANCFHTSWEQLYNIQTGTLTSSSLFKQNGPDILKTNVFLIEIQDINFALKKIMIPQAVPFKMLIVEIYNGNLAIIIVKNLWRHSIIVHGILKIPCLFQIMKFIFQSVGEWRICWAN